MEDHPAETAKAVLPPTHPTSNNTVFHETESSMLQFELAKSSSPYAQQSHCLPLVLIIKQQLTLSTAATGNDWMRNLVCSDAFTLNKDISHDVH